MLLNGISTRLPTVEKNHKLVGSTKFTKLDGISSCLCVALGYESSLLTTFRHMAKDMCRNDQLQKYRLTFYNPVMVYYCCVGVRALEAKATGHSYWRSVALSY